jgi:hypothetical protein
MVTPKRTSAIHIGIFGGEFSNPSDFFPDQNISRFKERPDPLSDSLGISRISAKISAHGKKS